jgi:hypothetical protein
MGSWTELDAIYPPDALTPATALVVTLCLVAEPALRDAALSSGNLASLLRRADLKALLTSDVSTRALRFLREVPPERMLLEAAARLNRDQRQAVLLHLAEELRAARHPSPLEHHFFIQARAVLGEDLPTGALDSQPHPRLRELALFPQ